MSFDARHPARTRLAVLAVALLGAGGLVLASPGVPGSAATADEAALASLVNGARSGAGLAPLTVSAALSDTARSHSAAMAAAGSLFHSSDLGGSIGGAVGDWTDVAENVAVAGSATEAHQAIMGSAVHRANVLGDFTLLGVGVVRGGDGRVWVTERFAKTTAVVVVAGPEPVPPAPVSEPTPAAVDVAAAGVVVTTTVTSAPEPAPAPRPARARLVRPARPPVRAAAASASVAPAADGGDCLPPQAHGHGHAYGRCDQVPRGGGGGRP